MSVCAAEIAVCTVPRERRWSLSCPGTPPLAYPGEYECLTHPYLRQASQEVDAPPQGAVKSGKRTLRWPAWREGGLFFPRWRAGDSPCS